MPYLTAPELIDLVAFHEASHCIAFYQFGIPFVACHIVHRENGSITGCTHRLACDIDHRKLAVAVLAGGVGEAVATGVPVLEVLTSKPCLRDLSYALNRLNYVDQPTSIKMLIPVTEQLVHQEFAAITRLARALKRTGHLDAEHAVAIIEQAQSNPIWLH